MADRVRWCEDGIIPAPGTCSVCGYANGGKRKMATVGVHVKYYGHVLFCETCVNTIAHLPGLNFVRKDAVEKAEAERDEYRGKLDTLRDELIDSIVSSVSSLRSAHDVRSVVVESAEPEPDLFGVLEGDSDSTVSAKKSLGLFD